MKGDSAFPLIAAPDGYGKRDLIIEPNQKRDGLLPSRLHVCETFSVRRSHRCIKHFGLSHGGPEDLEDIDEDAQNCRARNGRQAAGEESLQEGDGRMVFAVGVWLLT